MHFGVSNPLSPMGLGYRVHQNPVCILVHPSAPNTLSPMRLGHRCTKIQFAFWFIQSTQPYGPYRVHQNPVCILVYPIHSALWALGIVAPKSSMHFGASNPLSLMGLMHKMQQNPVHILVHPIHSALWAVGIGRNKI